MDHLTNGRRTVNSDGRYRIVRQIGVGGMGHVYEAIDRRLNASVALKFVSDDRLTRRRSLRQLEHEAAAMLVATGQRICRIYGLDECAGRPCIVMERLIGQTLQARMEQGPLQTREVVDIAIQIAAALAAVHRTGLVHQDIKPANIFLAPTGSVKLLDFGVAMWNGMSQPDASTRRGGDRWSILGTTNYIAPERILRRPVDPRSDLFSLGAIIYEMLTGRQAFEGASPVEVLFKVLESNPTPVRDLAPTRPAAMERLVQRLLAKSSRKRYRSAAAVTRALARIQIGGTIPVRSGLPRLHFTGGNRSHASNENGYRRVQ